MVFLVIEKYKKEKIKELYTRFDKNGRMLPIGVKYVNSWIDENVEACYQIMECSSIELIYEWSKKWDDLVSFKVIPVIDSIEAKRRVLSSSNQFLKFIKANTEVHYQKIEQLAWEILPKHYAPYIPNEHTIFFLEKFQTKKAVQNQVNRGVQYYILEFLHEDIGYLAFEITNNTMLLSKLYIKDNFRSKGFGKQSIQFVTMHSNKVEANKIELIVNRKTKNTIKFYERNGFRIVDSVINEFENGYSIEDYIMEKGVC